MKTTPAQFVRQVKQEVQKITWPTKKEVTVGTVWVIFLCFVLALFVLVVDVIFNKIVEMIIGG